VSLRKISVCVTRTIAFVLSVVLLLGALPALAAPIPADGLSATVGTDGKFSINLPATRTIPVDTTVRSAILRLPSGGGMIESIQITDNNPPKSNPSGLAFGCVNVRVKNKTNLIKSCGGPAQLRSGTTYSYVASGSGFKPNTKFSIRLYDQFNEGES
jgi:hypothetical protein